MWGKEKLVYLNFQHRIKLQMKIGFDAKRLFNNNTGLGNYSRTLVGNLMRCYPEDEHVLYASRVGGVGAAFAADYEGQFTMRKGRGGLWRSHGMWRDVVRDGVDVFHGLSHDMPYGTRGAGDVGGVGGAGGVVGRVVTVHDVCYKTYPDMFPLVERLIYSEKYRHACHVADRIIAISQSTRRDLVELLGVDDSKIEVVYQAMNPVYYDYRLPGEMGAELCEHNTLHESEIRARYGVSGDYMLYVGSINSRKNLLGLLKAYAMLPGDLRLPLVVVGNGGGYKKECMAWAASHGILSRLVLLDGVSSAEDLRALYAGAVVMVYPSFYEGFGLPVTEAMLCGTPVITSNVSSLPEAGGEAACYVDPYTVEDIAQALVRVLESAALRAEMSEVGLRWARDTFEPQLLTAEVRGVYCSVLG